MADPETGTQLPTSPAGSPAGEPPKPEATTAPPNPLDMKLDGDAVPENLRGKSVAEALRIMGDIQSGKTVAEQAAAQWKAVYEAEKRGTSTVPAAAQKNQLDILEPDAAKAIEAFVDQRFMERIQRLGPIVDGFVNMQKEITKAQAPDFASMEKEITDVFNTLSPNMQFDPKFGWGYAYHLVKASKQNPISAFPVMAKPPVPGVSLTPGSAGTPSDALTPEEVAISAKLGMSVDNYKKYRKVYDPMGGEKP